MIVTYVRTDYWSRDLYKSTKTGKIFADVDGVLHTITDEGEPCCPVVKLSEVTVIPEEQCTCVPGDERREICSYCKDRLSKEPMPF